MRSPLPPKAQIPHQLSPFQNSHSTQQNKPIQNQYFRSQTSHPNNAQFPIQQPSTKSQPTYLPPQLQIQPLKKLSNISTLYKICHKMILAKYKIKDLIYQNSQIQQPLYIILNGKIAFYKQSAQFFQNDQLIVVHPGTCFGKFYQWNVNFIPIAIEQSLFAIATKIQVNKIPMLLSFQHQTILHQLKNSDIFRNSTLPLETLSQYSKLLTLNKIPCNTFLIRQGQTPKALFYIMKGIIKKLLTKNNKTIQIKQYSQSQYCPQQLNLPLDHDLIAQTSCQIIVIPKKVLQIINYPIIKSSSHINVERYVNQQLKKKKEWKIVKENLMEEYSHKFKLPNKKTNNKWK